MKSEEVVLRYIRESVSHNEGKPVNILRDTIIDGVADDLVDRTMNRLQAQGRIQIWKRHEYRDGGNRVLSFYGVDLVGG